MASTGTSSVGDRRSTVQRLAQEIQALRVGLYAVERNEVRRFRLGIPELDRLLPEEGISRRCLLEWLGELGSGAWSLAVRTVAAAAEEQGRAGKVVVVDVGGEFYPPAAFPWGLTAEQLLVVRPRSVSEAIWALDEAVRCAAVAAVLGIVDRLDHRASRRLQLAAESGGRPCVLIRPVAAINEASWAELRWLVQAVPCSAHRGRIVRVELLRCRGRMDSAALYLEMDDAAGIVRVVPELAAAASGARPPRTALRVARAV